MDSLILCKFLRGVFAGLLHRGERYAAEGDGLGCTAGELRRKPPGAIVAAKREVNLLAGWTRRRTRCRNAS